MTQSFAPSKFSSLLNLPQAVKKQLQLFAEDCKSLRAEVDRAAAKAQEAEAAEAAEAAVEEVESEAVTKTRGLAEVMYSYEEEHARAAYVACQKLLDIPKDTVTIPEAWQVDPYWKKVQERQVWRYDPEWSLKIKDGASCFLQMLRLGVPLDPSAKLKGQQAQQACVVYLGCPGFPFVHFHATPYLLHHGCLFNDQFFYSIFFCVGVVLRSSIPEYSQLRQVLHAQMKELYARGYVTYSNLCNKAFQDRIFK